MKSVVGYKLFNQRKDGTLGSLFINRKQRIPVGRWLAAGDYPTKGFKHRPGWHVMSTKSAPHLKEEGRIWAKVEIFEYKECQRPKNQGGLWYIADLMRVLEIL